MTEKEHLAYLACGLVLISAAIHLLIGLTGLYEAAIGTRSSTLPLLFITAAIMASVLLIAYQFERLEPTHTYAVGTGLMVVFILAYVDLHIFGYCESVLGVDFHGHDHGHAQPAHHGKSALALLVDHLREDVYALIAKGAEAGAATMLAVLYVLERR